MLDLNCATIQGTGGLLERLAAITDPWAKPGVRHRLVSLLAIAAAATLSGAKSLVAVGEFAAELPQEALARLGARPHPVTGRYVAPHEAALRRAIRSVDPDQLDRVLGGWLAEQPHPVPGNSSVHNAGRSQMAATLLDHHAKGPPGRRPGDLRSGSPGDDEVDALYLDVERRILHLFALQTPVATDLRLLTACCTSTCIWSASATRP